MRFEELLDAVGREPVFETGLLLCGDVSRADVQRQLSRWTAAGRLTQLRRGLYALAPRYRKTEAHPFVIANRLVQPSYVSLQAALAFYGVIPEAVPVVTSITTGRPEERSTPLGEYLFRHVKVPMFSGYRLVPVSLGREGAPGAFVAEPEKALVDLLYLESGSDSKGYLSELRLDIDGVLDIDRLQHLAEASGSTKVCRAVDLIVEREQAETDSVVEL